MPEASVPRPARTIAVIPANAGIHFHLRGDGGTVKIKMDSCLRRNDELGGHGETRGHEDTGALGETGSQCHTGGGGEHTRFGKIPLRRLVVLACLWLLAATGALAAPRIGVVTMQPGEVFWERFGHDAIVVVDPATGRAVSYNFGFFDPTEPDFVSRFIRGEMRYRLAALPFEQDLATYRDEGRGVSVQWLALDDARAQALADALAVNARPENAFYSYQYFLDNCSTRVRDAIDQALGGALRRQLAGRSHGNTFRSEALRLASPAPWMWLGFDLGLGPAADRPMSLWQEAYVPMRLADALGEVKNARGAPLVASEQPLLPHRIAPAPQGEPVDWWKWGLAGVVLAAGAVWLGRRHPRVLAAVAMPLWIGSGALGLLMLFIWFGTGHRFGWANHNLLLFSPLAWLLLPGAWRTSRGREPGRWFRWLLAAIAAGAVLGLFGYWLSAWPQRNLHWIVLMLPVHLALAWTYRPRASGAPVA